jgi:hypothetical protein
MNVISSLAQRGNYRLFERLVNATVVTVFNAMQSHPKRIRRRFHESTPGALLAIISNQSSFSTRHQITMAK